MKHSLILTALVALTVTACGDSDSTRTRDPLPVVVEDDVMVVGPITGFGSVIVNGVHFNTDAATVTMDDEPGTPFDLRLGMVVSVMGTIDSATGAATAGQINFVDKAEGPITSIDHAAGNFVLLGQTVFSDELTIFENAEFENLAAGNVVQVSGLWRNQEQIQATHVYLVANEYQVGMTMEVKGVIDDLDIGNQRFRIGTQSCDYSAAMLQLGDVDLANGLYVQASSGTPIDGGHMILNQVQAREQDRNRYQFCTADCTFELVGYVTSFTSTTEFEVDGQAVTTTSSTIYINGTDDMLALDVKVSINGTFNDDGVLVADRIVFHLPSLVEIKGYVDGLDTGTETVSVFGIVVQTNEFTLFRDHTTSGQPTFDFGDLSDGDRVEIRAVLDGDSVIATRLERGEPNDVATLKALVDTIERPSITMLGVTVTSNQDTVFQNAAHIEIDADEFFDLVEPGSIVRSEGTYEGNSITASKMFLRECLNNCL